MKIINKKRIGLLSILTLLTISFTNINKVQAVNMPISNEEQITISEAYSNPINTNASVSFIDPDLERGLSIQKGIVVPMGAISEIYDHSTYTYQGRSLTGTLVGPREKETIWKTMARGETYSVTDSTTLSGTVKIEGSVKTGIPAVINASVSGSASATVSHHWSSTTTLSGPSAPYNSRLYYHAVDYNKYSYKLNRTDYYKVYNGGIYQKTITYSGTETVSSVKCPVFMSYSKDVTY